MLEKLGNAFFGLLLIVIVLSVVVGGVSPTPTPEPTPEDVNRTVLFYCGHDVTKAQRVVQLPTNVRITCSDGGRKDVDYIFAKPSAEELAEQKQKSEEALMIWTNNPVYKAKALLEVSK